MLLLTYSYVVPKDKRTEHARLLHRMKQVMARLGVEHFEAYEQVGKHWTGGDVTGRVVQILRFRDKAHFAAIQAAEKTDPGAQQLIAEFCDLVNLPYQQQTGMFADGYYGSIIAGGATRAPAAVFPPVASAAASPLTPVPADTVPQSEQIDPGNRPTAATSPDDTAIDISPVDETPDGPPGEVPDAARFDQHDPDARANGEADVLEYLGEPDSPAEDESRR